MRVEDARNRKRYTIKEDPVSRYYYHLSEEDFGDRFSLDPRPYGSNRDSEESAIPRICVCPSLKLCFCAVDLGGNVSVYRTKNKEIAYRTINVRDSRLTQERWLIKRTAFIKAWTIPEYITDDISAIHVDCELIQFGSDIPGIYDKQKKFKKRIMRYFSMIDIPDLEFSVV